MQTYAMEMEANFIQLIVSPILLIWFALKNRNSMTLYKRLLVWGLVGYLLRNIYWNSMLAVDGNGTYAFTACDAATIGLFLIWAAMFRLRRKEPIPRVSAVPVSGIVILLFGLWNLVWWVLWSGHWLVNTMDALPLITLLLLILFSLDRAGAVRKCHRVLWCAAALVLVLAQPVIFLGDGRLKTVFGLISAAAWLFHLLLFAVCGFRDRENRTAWFFACLTESLFAQYLTDGLTYSVFMMLETAALCLVVINFRSEEFEREGAV